MEQQHLSHSVSIGNTPPYYTLTTSITTTGLQVGDTWTCTAIGEDLEDGSLTPSYIWQDMNGSFIQSGSSLTLSASNSDPGYPITCVATITDSGGLSLDSSASETVVNSSPSTPSISITPSAPVAGVDDLVCTIASQSIDPDGQTITYNSDGITLQVSNVHPVLLLFRIRFRSKHHGRHLDVSGDSL